MGNFNFRREYRGQVQGLVLDWSGTTADAFVIAPAVVVVEVFQNQKKSIADIEPVIAVVNALDLLGV